MAYKSLVKKLNGLLLSPDSTTDDLTVNDIEGLHYEISNVAFASDIAAGTPQAEFAIFAVSKPIKTVSVIYVPNAAVSGDNTDNMTLTIRHRTNAAPGSPTTVKALTFNDGEDLTAHKAKIITLGSIVSMAPLDTLTFEKSEGGLGMVLPAGLLQVVATRE